MHDNWMIRGNVIYLYLMKICTKQCCYKKNLNSYSSIHKGYVTSNRNVKFKVRFSRRIIVLLSLFLLFNNKATF